VASDDEVLRLLTSIDRRLALLTATQERDLRVALETDVLRTRPRTAMFDAIDGVRTGADLAKLGGASERAGQLFVNELLGLGLVRQVETGRRGVVVERNDAGILAWYLGRNT
jgi:hypothetical protein